MIKAMTKIMSVKLKLMLFN